VDNVNLKKFNKAKCKVLHTGQGNSWYQYRLGDAGIESSSAKKYLRVPVHEKRDMTRQCALVAQKPNRILGCITRSTASRSREIILPLCSTLMTPYPENCVHSHSTALSPYYKKDMHPFKAGPEEAHKNDQRDEHFSYEKRLRDCGFSLKRNLWLEHLSYEDRLRELGLFSLEKRRLRDDLRAAFQHLKGAYRKDGEGLFTRVCSDRTRGNGFTLKEGRFGLGIRKKFSP